MSRVRFGPSGTLNIRGLSVPLVAVVSVALGMSIAGGSSLFVAIPVVLWLVIGFARHGSKGLLVSAILVAPLQTYIPSLGLPYVWVLSGAALVAAVVERAQDRAMYHLSHLQIWSLLVLVGVTAVSAVSGSARAESLIPNWMTIIFGIVGYLAVLQTVRTRETGIVCLKAFVVSALVVVLLGLLQLMFPGLLVPGVVGGHAGTFSQQAGASFVRLSGPIGDYELFGEFAAIGLVAAAWLALRASGQWERIRWSTAVGLLLVGLVMSGTRGALLIAALGVVFLLLGRTGGMRTRAFTLLLLMLSIGVALLVASDGVSMMSSRLLGTPFQSDLGATLNRGSVWVLFLKTFTKSMPVWGFGSEFPFSQWRTYPHSLYIFTLYTLGPLGLTALVTLFVHAASGLISSRERPQSILGSLSQIGGLLVALLLVHELKVEFLRSYNYSHVVFLLVGFGAAAKSLASVAERNVKS